MRRRAAPCWPAFCPVVAYGGKAAEQRYNPAAPDVHWAAVERLAAEISLRICETSRSYSPLAIEWRRTIRLKAASSIVAKSLSKSSRPNNS